MYIGSGGEHGSLVDSDILNCDVGVESLSPLGVTNVDIDSATVAGIVAYDTLSVDDSQIGSSIGEGVHLRAGALGSIRDSDITGSDFSAIVCDTCAAGTSIRRTTIDAAGLHGIHVVMASDVLIDSCVVANSASAAVRFEWAGGMVRKSRLDGNAGGVVCFNSSSPVIQECSMDGNTGGVSAVYDSYPVVGFGTSGGLNCITNTTGYHVSNLNSPGTIFARHDYWGLVCCKSSKFFGNVSCDSCETSAACDAASASAVAMSAEASDAADCLAVQDERAPALPEKLDLVSAAPNPFNPSVRIRYAVPAGGADVRLTIYNVRGQRVAVLQDGPTPPGYHEVIWHGVTARGIAAASGVYFVRMSAGGFTKTMKLVLLK